MKTFEIKHRWTEEVIFKLECESFKICVEAAIEAQADLSGSDLSYSDLSGSDLRGSDLSGSDLRGSDLRGSDLRGSNLSGSDGEKIKIEKTPVQILGLRWDILIFDAHMKIGCEFHKISEWQGFDNDKIERMDGNALSFWEINKASLLAICAANERH